MQKIIGKITRWDRSFPAQEKPKKGLSIRGPWRRWLFSTVKDQDVSWVTFSLPLALSCLIFSIWTWTKAESVFFKYADEPKLKIIILDDKIRLQKGLGSQEWWVNIYRIR